MDGWDIVLMVLVSYVAVMTMVRLMIRYRNQMITQLLREAEEEQARQPAPDLHPSPSGPNGSNGSNGSNGAKPTGPGKPVTPDGQETVSARAEEESRIVEHGQGTCTSRRSAAR